MIKLFKEYWSNPYGQIGRAVLGIELLSVLSAYLIYKTF